MTKQRKQYSKEFKLEMVKPIEEQNQRVVDIDLCCQQRRKTFGRFHQAA